MEPPPTATSVQRPLFFVLANKKSMHWLCFKTILQRYFFIYNGHFLLYPRGLLYLLLYNICSTCRNRSDQWPVKNPPTFMVECDFNLSFTIRWELEDTTFLKIDNICLDDSLKYRIMAIKTNKNFTPFSNSVTFRKPRGLDLVTASELMPGFCRSKSNVPTPGSLRTIKSPTGG